MAKTTVFVLTCSAVIMALFGASLYMMSTVNPPPLATPASETTKYGENLANFYLRHMTPADVLDYGMERSHKPKPSPAPHFRTNITNYIPTVKNKNPHLAKVYPPIWPAKTTSDLHTSKETPTTIAVTHKDVTNISKVESPIHRRSINVIEKNIDKKSGAVILKILDDDGKSRIEIKLHPEDMFEKKNSRPHRSFLNDHTQKNNLEVPNTEIKILPNDTVIINNNNDSRETIDFRTKYIDHKHTVNSETSDISNILYPKENNTHFNKTVKAVNKSENYTETIPKNESLLNVTDLQNTTQTNVKSYSPSKEFTTTDVFELKVMFDNVSRSFTEDYSASVLRNKTL